MNKLVWQLNALTNRNRIAKFEGRDRAHKDCRFSRASSGGAGKRIARDFRWAGVSIPPPSNYPDFKGLANQVAAGAWTLGENEPIERFLGGLVDKHISVHERVAELLANPDSRPTSLHFDLLRLFDSAAKARIVTTNFDLHFSSAARTLFTGNEACEVYAAPALPLGHFFNGIVYIHGAVDHPPRRLVLTDTDFGHAYLTEGWARLFLQRVFESFTVLFVGYSHDDPVMNYLARGFTPEMNRARRYALSVRGGEDVLAQPEMER
jgi:hypothetical protein